MGGARKRRPETQREPVAAVVPMEGFRRLHPETARAKGKGRRLALSEAEGAKGERQGAPSLAYELPADLLAVYHRLVDKKFSEGLTPEEKAEFERVGEATDLTPSGLTISSLCKRNYPLPCRSFRRRTRGTERRTHRGSDVSESL